MKRIKQLCLLLFCGLLFSSCGDFEEGSSIPECIWSVDYPIQLNNFQLDYPSVLSQFHIIQIPFDGYDYDLNTVLMRLGDGNWFGGHNAKLEVKLISDGVACRGTKNSVFYGGSASINNNSINVKIPSDGFFGEVKVNLSSDDYNATFSTEYLDYYVYWSETSNDPLDVNYNTLGVRKNYAIDGTTGRGVVIEDNGNPSAFMYEGGSRQNLN